MPLDDMDDIPPGSEPKKAAPATGGLKRSGSQRNLTRSNSVERTGSSSLKHSKRKGASEKSSGLAAEAMKDFSVIAVYSREAFENFGRTWKDRMKTDSLSRATKKSRTGVDKSDSSDRISRLSTSTVSTGFNDQVQALLENRNIPHVIAVIEGKKEQAALTLKTQLENKSVDFAYTLKKFTQGQNSLGANDDKQSMSFYVRKDMEDVYSFSDVNVPHGSESIRTVGVDYKTEDGKVYRSLVVHIPNQFVGTASKEQATVKAFSDYAAAQKDVVVTGFSGDTNFQRPFFKNSVPSMGGHLPSGDTLNPQSSGAKKDTNFMQSIPLGDSADGHLVMQPATLNYVFLDSDASNKAATDHPSMLAITAHPSELAGRNPGAVPDYYGI